VEREWGAFSMLMNREGGEREKELLVVCKSMY
jgi:hypothetical protein